jgi:hypothetical protein
MLLSHDDVERRMLSAICHMDSGVTGQSESPLGNAELSV